MRLEVSYATEFVALPWFPRKELAGSNLKHTGYDPPAVYHQSCLKSVTSRRAASIRRVISWPADIGVSL